VGLGPSTVVGLEGALAHVVLRYCTAIRGSVLKVVRGQDGTGQLVRRCKLISTGQSPTDSAVDRSQSETRGHECCEKDTGMRKRPSTQAWTTVREPDAHGQTRVVCHQTAPPNRAKKAYGGAAGLSLSGDTPMNTRFCEHEHCDLDPRTAHREGRTLISIATTSFSTAYAQSVDNHVEERHTMLGRQSDGHCLDHGNGREMYRS